MLEAKRLQKREETRKEHQRRLELLIMETEVDWDEISKLMVTPGIQPNVKEFGTGVTTLHRAAYAGQIDVLLWCIHEKGDVNARSLLGRSPLHYACDGCQPRCIKELVSHKADSNIRTLSYLTPLHLCCQANSIEAVNAILADKDQVVDIDAEDTLHRRPEAMTSDRTILRLIRKYRATLDDRRKQQMIEQCLVRLFKFFDVDGDGCIHPEEWVDTMTLLSEHFEHHCDTSISDMFSEADKDHNGYIDWDEFKASHVDLLKVINVPFRGLMDMLADIEQAMFKEKIEAEKQAMQQKGRKSVLVLTQAALQLGDEDGGNADGDAAPEEAFLKFRAAVQTPQAKAISVRRRAMKILEVEAGLGEHKASIQAEEVDAQDVLPPTAPGLSMTLTPSPVHDRRSQKCLPRMS